MRKRPQQKHNHAPGTHCFICTLPGDLSLDAQQRKLADKIITDIANTGWSVIMVGEGDDSPAFAYTVGLTPSYGHPEVIMVGLPLGIMGTMLNQVGSNIKNGKKYAPAEDIAYQEIIRAHSARFIPVPQAVAERVMHMARIHYGEPGFTAIQFVWPDVEDRFPWDDGFDPGLIGLQELPLA